MQKIVEKSEQFYAGASFEQAPDARQLPMPPHFWLRRDLDGGDSKSLRAEKEKEKEKDKRDNGRVAETILISIKKEERIANRGKSKA